MMRNLYIYICVICKISFIGQNLVPNYSFELHSGCPNASGAINFVNNWFASGTNNTPDYYNACATNTVFGVPFHSAFDFQPSASGNSYVGIWVYSTLGFSREYIQTVLTQQLVLDNYYYFKMKINLNNYSKYSINKIGAMLSNSTNLPLYTTPTNTNVLGNYLNPFIKDTMIWTDVHSIYKANGTEQYLSIGNFFNDINTDTVILSYASYPYSYYFIDDVSVEPICNPFWNYRDSSCVIGDSVLIGPAITGLNINWYDANNNLIANAPGIYVNPTQTTTYTAIEDFCGTTFTNNIVVTVLPTSIKKLNNQNKVFSVYPNPTTNTFVIVTDEVETSLLIQIYDLQGKLIYKTNVNVKNYEASILPNIDNGAYFINILNTNNNKSTVLKLIIQK